MARADGMAQSRVNIRQGIVACGIRQYGRRLHQLTPGHGLVARADFVIDQRNPAPGSGK
ncbi:hypothetical protein [Pseudoxanthomonas sp.]|uniref:hypothetical protein n=1 Tax=Pseudoxanthomonas sp. TaxID=1871049 RepID=UPI0026098F93|nr:hypothetical protein [Pseudoxanthomonas sp.]WDS34991.1 MAG: hypothetical protein O8I58_11450 [Pseudoxanthomonas sp.]